MNALLHSYQNSPTIPPAENGKVKHRTISNISKLPADQIFQIKKMLQGKKGSFNINDLENGKTYEYGASYVFFMLAKKLGLDKATFSRYINGVRKIPLCIAVKIERLTKGEVQCRHLV